SRASHAVRRGLETRATDEINARRADGVDSPWIFAKLLNSRCTLLRGGEVDVSKFRYCVSQRIINLPQRSITTLDVGDDFSRDVPRRRCCEGFDTIADHKNDIAVETIEGLGQHGDGAARAARVFQRAPLPRVPRHRRVDLVIDRIDTSSMPAIEVHSR